jgi:pimeloyl-ACP methyl ester carboxylesterase
MFDAFHSPGSALSTARRIMQTATTTVRYDEVSIQCGDAILAGDVSLPDNASALVIFAHGSGSSRRSPRNRAVARSFQREGLGTLLFDLLTPEEERLEQRTRHLRFDISMLANRLADVTRWTDSFGQLSELPVGYFGASTGAAAALVAAAKSSGRVSAVVSRGGRPDLAGGFLPQVNAPTLLIVGSLDVTVVDLNRDAYARLRCEKRLEIVPDATHLFEEPGALEQVARLASNWFLKHLRTAGSSTHDGRPIQRSV